MSKSRPLLGILTGILTGALALGVLPDADGRLTDVIVRGTDLDAVIAAVTTHGGSVELEIDLIDAVAADVPEHLLDELAADVRTTEVTPDGTVEVLGRDLHQKHRGWTGQEAGHLVGGGPADWNRDLDGTGIDVAVVDTGIDADVLPGTHVTRGVNVSFEASHAGDAGHGDGHGHGTAMAGIIAGNTRHFQGIAREARLVDVKVADERGVADVSQVLAGIDWVVTNRATDGRDIRVLSLSFGTDGSNSAATSPLAYAVEAAWRHGIVVVAAAGNHGAELGRLTIPAVSPNILAVGAADLTDVDRYDELDHATVPAWSAVGSAERAPDLVAPGRSLLGGRAAGSAVERGYPDAHEDDYLLGSGTSQAAAFTAGVAAAMLEADRGLSPDEVKALLVATARPLAGESPAQAGAGILDMGRLFPAGRLTQQPVTTDDHDWSTGTGSLDGDRGRFVLVDADGNHLTGEHTVVGPFDRAAWMGSTWTGSTWTGSTWTGSTWTGSTWTGSTWTGSTWTGSTWTGSTWTGSTWTGSTWTNVRWGE